MTVKLTEEKGPEAVCAGICSSNTHLECGNVHCAGANSECDEDQSEVVRVYEESGVSINVVCGLYARDTYNRASPSSRRSIPQLRRRQSDSCTPVKRVRPSRSRRSRHSQTHVVAHNVKTFNHKRSLAYESQLQPVALTWASSALRSSGRVLEGVCRVWNHLGAERDHERNVD